MSSGYGGDHIELNSLSINDHYYHYYYSHICGCSAGLVLTQFVIIIIIFFSLRICISNKVEILNSLFWFFLCPPFQCMKKSSTMRTKFEHYFITVFFWGFFVRIKRNPLRWLNEGLSLGSRLTFFFLLFFSTTHPPPHNTHRRIIFILESKDAFEIKWIQVFCQNAEICQKKKKKTLCTRTECIFSILHSSLNIARWD